MKIVKFAEGKYGLRRTSFRGYEFCDLTELGESNWYNRERASWIREKTEGDIVAACRAYETVRQRGFWCWLTNSASNIYLGYLVDSKYIEKQVMLSRLKGASE